MGRDLFVFVDYDHLREVCFAAIRALRASVVDLIFLSIQNVSILIDHPAEDPCLPALEQRRRCIASASEH